MYTEKTIKNKVMEFNNILGINAKYNDDNGFIEILKDEDIIKIEKTFNIDYKYIAFAHNKDVPYSPGYPDTYDIVNDKFALTTERVHYGYYHFNPLYKDKRGIMRLTYFGLLDLLKILKAGA